MTGGTGGDVNPARAGMIPVSGCTARTVPSKPRASGDDPKEGAPPEWVAP